MMRRVVHTAAAVGLTTLLVVLRGASGARGALSQTTRALVVSDQARRYLTLAYGSLPPRIRPSGV